MAERVIDDPLFILQRNFSIYDLLPRQNNKQLSQHKLNQHSCSSISAIPMRRDKEN